MCNHRQIRYIFDWFLVSFIAIKNKVMLNIDPCGTLLEISVLFEIKYLFCRLRRRRWIYFLGN